MYFVVPQDTGDVFMGSAGCPRECYVAAIFVNLLYISSYVRIYVTVASTGHVRGPVNFIAINLITGY